MGDVKEHKGLGDIRTATSTRLHSKPAQKGTAHRDLYLLGKERERLEKEIVRLEWQKKRVEEHLVEVRKTMEKLEEEAEQERLSEESSTEFRPRGNQPAPLVKYSQRALKKMPFDY